MHVFASTYGWFGLACLVAFAATMFFSSQIDQRRDRYLQLPLVQRMAQTTIPGMKAKKVAVWVSLGTTLLFAVCFAIGGLVAIDTSRLLL